MAPRNLIWVVHVLLLFSLSTFSNGNSEDEVPGRDEGFMGVAGNVEHKLGDLVDLANVGFANDDPESSGDDDDNLIPVTPKLRKAPKSQPDQDTSTVAFDMTVEQTSFQPVELAIEHKHPVTSGEETEAHTETPDDTGFRPEGRAENELRPEETIKLQAAPARTAHEPPEGHDAGDLFDNGVVTGNATDVKSGESTERTQRRGLSNIAKIGIAMGAIVLFWLLLCPVVCFVCRRRDRKREKHAQEEEFKLKNGAPTPSQQKPLVGDLGMTELGFKDGGKPVANGKQKLYGNDAVNADELQRLNSKSSPKADVHSNGSHSTFGKSPGKAPLASTEQLDTEV